jgi:alanine racemase
MKMFRKTFAEVDLDVLARNYLAIARAFPADTFICPMVKANAYGHGDIPVAKKLESLGAKHIGVCLLEEGLRLRSAGIKNEILVFGCFHADGAQELLQAKLTPVVSDWEQLKTLAQFSEFEINLHVKFDTGMHRLGFQIEEAVQIYDFVVQNKHLKISGVLTHLSQAEDVADENGCTAMQIRKFNQIKQIFSSFNPYFHILNSASLAYKIQLNQKVSPLGLQNPVMIQNWGLRPGLILYEASMSLRSHIQLIRRVKKNETVSYGGTWRAQKDSLVAVIPTGYADGYLRKLSNKSHVLVGPYRAPVIGHVCMDYLMVDVSELNEKIKLEADLEIVLFGRSNTPDVQNEISVDELARHAETIPWEILTAVSARVPRIYKGAI